MDDVTNSGAHINDEFNVSDAQGRVLVNVGHPEKEEDIFLASQLAAAVKPHQVCYVNFLISDECRCSIKRSYLLLFTRIQ